MIEPQPELQPLRPASVEDAPQLAELDRVCFPSHAYPEELIGRIIDLGFPSVVVDDTGSSRPIAFAMLMPEPEEGTAALMTIDVDPDHRRRGLGTRLLRWSAEQLLAMEEPIRLMWLTVATGNDGALSFYRALGFVEVDRVEGYYGDDSAVVMVNDDLRSLAGRGVR